MIQTYRYNEPLKLERGGELKNLEIAYSTFGTLNDKKDNVIWVCHALTANSDVADWWPNTVVEGGFLDPEKWFVVCANIIGSHYGSTGPLSINPSTGKPYYGTFPQLTIRDIVRAHQLLAAHLGIDEKYALIGSSLGGFQAMEWAMMEPEKVKKLVLIATDTSVTPWAAGLNETQRMAIKADPTYGEERDNAGMDGMAVARAIALLSYRGASGYNLSQKNKDTAPYHHRVSSYQRYQGEKLCRRFNAYSYMTILDAFDSHDVRRGRDPEALKGIKAHTLCVAIPTDILFPADSVKKMSREIPGAEYKEILSEFGHDGFLVEHGQLNEILKEFLKK